MVFSLPDTFNPLCCARLINPSRKEVVFVPHYPLPTFKPMIEEAYELFVCRNLSTKSMGYSVMNLTLVDKVDNDLPIKVLVLNDSPYTVSDYRSNLRHNWEISLLRLRLIELWM